MSQLDSIRAAIVARMNTVVSIGQVHSYERFAKATSDFRQKYETSNRILGWNVRRKAKRVMSQTLGRSVVFNEWEIKGFMSLDDADQTEILFDNLVESLGDVFLADETLGGVVASIVTPEGEAGLQLQESNPVMFLGVMCHSARLKLTTIHYQ